MIIDKKMLQELVYTDADNNEEIDAACLKRLRRVCEDYGEDGEIIGHSQESITPITPNEGQSNALEAIHVFLRNRESTFVLKGSAGTGKTSLLNFVPELMPYGMAFGCGPTHKAVSVLNSKLPDGIGSSTIHSFLGLRPKRSADKTVLVKRNDYDPSDKAGIRLVLLDEGSMVGSELLSHVEKDAYKWDRKYLIIGDEYQLNPPGELDTPCFNMGAETYELTEIVRQAQDNPIIRCATGIRDAIKRDQEPPVLLGRNGEFGVDRLNNKNWKAKLEEYIENHDPDSFRILAYTNASVRRYNQLVRSMLGYDTSVPFSPGEWVVVNEAYTKNEQVILNTGTEFQVSEMGEVEHPAEPSLRGWLVILSDGENDLPITFPVLDHERCGDRYKKILANLVEYAKKNNDWRPYYNMVEFWCDLRPLYALTAHKSQGSTFDNVFIDYADIYSNRILAEADRCLYVSVTRPRYNAYILG